MGKEEKKKENGSCEGKKKGKEEKEKKWNGWLKSFRKYKEG